jgi:carbon-monoxide dehydrogenase medium subunit
MASQGALRIASPKHIGAVISPGAADVRNRDLKPAPFAYEAPTTLDGAIEQLRVHGGAARLLAGGQSLMPVLNFRLGRPRLLIDLNRIPELAFIRDDGDRLSIGAMTRECEIEDSALIQRHAPLLYEATRHIGHRAIRNRGTIGGSLAHADPAAEYPAAALALDCVMVVRGPGGERRIAAGDFFGGALTTTVGEDEILVRIEVPKVPGRSGTAFVEIARRPGDFALAGVAALIAVADGMVTDVRLAACGAGPGPTRLRAAERILHRDGIGAAMAAAKAAMADVSPETDLHATADYRRRLIGVVTARAIAQAAARADNAAS